MAQPYVGEIRIFAGNFAPAGWMFCAGQLLPISENETLFNLIGTTYGGDGVTTFALPDLRGRIPLHFGAGFTLAQTDGVETVTLTGPQLPMHSHAFLATQSLASSSATASSCRSPRTPPCSPCWAPRMAEAASPLSPCPMSRARRRCTRVRDPASACTTSGRPAAPRRSPC